MLTKFLKFKKERFLYVIKNIPKIWSFLSLSFINIIKRSDNSVFYAISLNIVLLT